MKEKEDLRQKEQCFKREKGVGGKDDMKGRKRERKIKKGGKI